MSMILCSTGSLIGRPNGRNYRLLEGLSKQLSCDGFEFMMYSTWYDEADALLEYLQSLGLNIPVVHCEKSIGENISIGGESEINKAFELFEINCKIASKLGSTKLVVHLWGGLTSDQHFENNLFAYSVLSETAKRYGLDLLIENVVCNCNDPMSHWCELREKYPDVHFVFDTKMAAFHNQMDLLYSPDYDWLWKEHHIRHYHVNDYGGGYMDWGNLRTLQIGKGNVDFKRFFDYVNSVGSVDTFTVESTAFNQEGIVDTEMLNQQFEYIRKSLK